MDPDNTKENIINITNNVDNSPHPIISEEPKYIKDTNAPQLNVGAFYIEETPFGVKKVIIHKQRSGYQYSESEKILDSDIRKEFIHFRLYQQMGISTPDSKLSTLDGETVLVTDPLNLLPINKISKEDKDLEVQTEHVKIVSMLFDNYDYNYNLSHSLAITSNEKVALKKSFIPKYNLGYDERNRYWNAKEKLLENDTELASRVSASLKALTPDIVLEVVQQSGLSDVESQELTRQILTNKHNLEIRLPKKDLETNSQFIDICKKLDPIIEQNPGNSKYLSISTKAQQIVEDIHKFSNMEVQNDTNKSVRSVIADAKQMISEIHKNSIWHPDEMIDRQNKLQHVRNNIKSLKNNFESLIYKQSLNKTLIIIDKEIDQNLREFRKNIESRVQGVSELIGITISRESDSKQLDHDHNELTHYINVPTQEQIEKCLDLLNEMQKNPILGISEHNLKDYVRNVKSLINRKNLLINMSISRSKMLVSTLSTYFGVKSSLQNGLLESSLRQKEKRGKYFTNSYQGQNIAILPQLCFATNGAALEYGGTGDREYDDSTVPNPDLTVGFVGLYPDVVDNNKIDEFSGIAGEYGRPYDKELHIFNPEHTDKNNQKGIEISIEKFLLFVPEKKRDEWIDFIKKPVDEGGAGKSDAWIEKHFKTYPSTVTLDIYLRYIANPQDLGFTPKLGTFLNLNERVYLHNGWNDRVYRWKSVEN